MSELNIGIEILKKNPVFVVMTNTDLTEGTGEGYPLAVTKLSSTAKRIGSGKYVMDSDCEVLEAFSFVARINGKTMTFVPGRIIGPTDEEKREEEIEIEKRLCAEKKDKALKKAKELGLSDDDIQYLRF